MKRLNPDTGRPFVRGDVREDGSVFCYYRADIRKDGTFCEQWRSSEMHAVRKIKANEYHLHRVQTDPEYVIRRQKYRDSQMSTKESHIRKIWLSTKHRAKKLGLDFNLTYEHLLSIAPDVCPILNTELAWCRRGGKKPKPDCPSLDKIKPELGYIEGNIQWISYKANMMKSNASFEELHKFADWVKNNIPK